MNSSKFDKTDKVSIFLVDDDKDDQEIFTEALKNINSSVDLTIFNSAKEIMKAMQLNDNMPDIIFLDLYMPVRDEEECLMDIRENPLFDNIPVVIYSTEFDVDRIERLFYLGANRYLRKPESFYSLIISVDTIVQSLKQNYLEGNAVVNIVA